MRRTKHFGNLILLDVGRDGRARKISRGSFVQEERPWQTAETELLTSLDASSGKRWRRKERQRVVFRTTQLTNPEDSPAGVSVSQMVNLS